MRAAEGRRLPAARRLWLLPLQQAQGSAERRLRRRSAQRAAQQRRLLGYERLQLVFHYGQGALRQADAWQRDLR